MPLVATELNPQRSTNMAAEIGTQAGSRRFAHLSNPDPSWQKVAAKQQSLEKLADGLYCLPMTEFRKVAYGPPPLPANAPVIGTDITVEQAEISVRDGARIGLRVYRPIEDGSNRLLFFNIHGGGWGNSRRILVRRVSRLTSKRDGLSGPQMQRRLRIAWWQPRIKRLWSASIIEGST